MAEDGVQSSESDFLGTYPILAKVAQVVFAIFSVGLIVDPFNSFHKISYGHRSAKLDDIAFIYITLGSFLIINTIFLIFHAILGERIPKRLAMMFTTVGCLFHIIAASLIVHNWRKMQGALISTYNNETYGSKQYLDMLISGGVFAFVTFAAFVAEAFVTIRY
ncbi:uncharacterized protein LOC122504587 [Leptopilina heterotoma]|uniref:uncharacterized protein LOC122504587 n=1 Tax=Leptopilina heterotoma TaxID=63436 RepID=UPI001CA8E8B3|nr:uncharacterized protein LOC122504587 [Leptopilina heterotoma]XP_043471698.1 uncharacterized protein LOC122504587 [Leptopilina heterotoma]XP_043471700.1 uncharacterized protein LOC122504587 [Leptopilina heterotoma]